MGSWLRDLVYALRVLSRQKALSLTVIGLLAVAIAANTAIFSIHNGLFLKPLPFDEPDRLVDVDEMAPRWNLEYTGVAYPDFHEWRNQNRTFDDLALWRPRSASLSGRGEARRVETLQVTHDYLRTLRLEPAVGRGFLEAEDKPGGEKLAMISYGMWQREFGGDEGVLGQSLKLDGVPHTIVGVLPPEAVFPRESDVWYLMQKDPAEMDGWYLRCLGRMKPGVTIDQARDDLTRVHKNLIETRDVNEITSPRLAPVVERQFGDSRTMTAIIFSAVGVLLLIACVNVAALMLARSWVRTREIGIRTALGASRARILRQLLTESALLAIGGVAAGIVLGQWFLKALVRSVPQELPAWVRLEPDWRFAVFCIALAVACAVLFGLAPALQVSRVHPQHALGDAGARASYGARKRRGMNALVVAEVALAVVLLVASGLLLKAWQKVRDVDPGFRAENVLVYDLVLPESVYTDDDERVRKIEQLVERHRALPGVLAVGGSTAPPLSGHWGSFFEVEGALPPGPDEQDPVILQRVVVPGYFEAMGIRLKTGRFFTSDDGITLGSYVVIVNETFADRFWPDADPLGKRLRFRGGGDVPWMTVVGVNYDVKHYGLDQQMRPGLYLPLKQYKVDFMDVVIKTAVEPTSLLPAIRQQVREMDPDVPVAQPMTMVQQVDRSLAMRSLSSRLFVLFAAVALAMAMAGLYGVISYMVGRRTHEIGIRMALGAHSANVLGMVLASGARLAVTGVLLGLVAAAGAARAMESMLFGVSPWDVPTYLAVAFLLFLISALANLLPARRAAAIQPTTALRVD